LQSAPSRFSQRIPKGVCIFLVFSMPGLRVGKLGVSHDGVIVESMSSGRVSMGMLVASTLPDCYTPCMNINFNATLPVRRLFGITFKLRVKGRLGKSLKGWFANPCQFTGQAHLAAEGAPWRPRNVEETVFLMFVSDFPHFSGPSPCIHQDGQWRLPL
jgi:hypothetical protein